MATISALFASADTGDRTAADALFAALYELHAMARRQLARNGAGATLGTTTLLHEAYLNISGREGVQFPDRARFMGYAAKVMRGLIIDYARSRQALKRGDGFEITCSAIGAMRGVSERTVQRHWEKARTCIYGALRRRV